MAPVDGPERKAALLTSSGDCADPLIDRQAYKDVKKQKSPFVPQVEPVAEPKAKIPEELFCIICKDLLQDAVMIPCCANSFCDGCVRQVLLESDNHECPECHETNVSPNTLMTNRFLRTAVLNFKKETGSRVKKLALVKYSRRHIENVESSQPSPDSTVENQPTHADSSPPEIEKLTVKDEIVNVKPEIPPTSEEQVESVPVNTDGDTTEAIIHLTFLLSKLSLRPGYDSQYDRLSQSRYANNEYHRSYERHEGHYEMEHDTHSRLEVQPRLHPERYRVHSHNIHKSPTAPFYPFSTILPVPPIIPPAPQVFAPQHPPPGTLRIDTLHIGAQPPPNGVGLLLPAAVSSVPPATLTKQLYESEDSHKDARIADDRRIDDNIEDFRREEKRYRGYSRERSRSRSQSSGQERSGTSSRYRSYSSSKSWTRSHSRCSSRLRSSRSRLPLSSRSRSRSPSRSWSNHKSYTRCRSRTRTESRSRSRTQAEPRLRRRK